MESTALGTIIVPVVLALVKTLAACWLASALAGGGCRAARRLVAGHAAAGGPAHSLDERRCLDWRRNDAAAPALGPGYRRRLAG